MRGLWRSRALAILVCVILGSHFAIPLSGTQEKTDDQLRKEYEPILGKYEFDTSDLGGGTFWLNYYIEDGHLWVDSGDGRPAIMQPVEGETFAFKAEDPEAGVFNISFEKDEQGFYSMNRVFIEMAGVEVVGRKIK